MSEQHWLLVESIVLDAAERDVAERRTFLDAACAGNDALRQDVESLLEFERDAEQFLQRSAMESAAQLATVDVTLDPAGLQIAGYKISEFLGAGGMGEVFRARDVRLERDVAIKIIRRDAEDQTTSARFEEEARAASRLNHPNIVTVHAIGSQDDVSYIVMELVSGQTLREVLALGPRPLPSTLEIATQLAAGLAAAHDRGVVHRDLKPENVMVTAGGLVKILDFGIARRHVASGAPTPQGSAPDSVRRVPATTAAGTAGYMSPEQAARGPVDHRSDQYSFGAIVYEMLARRPLSDRESDPRMAPARTRLELALRSIVDRCLSPTPGERYASTGDLAAAVRELRDGSNTSRPRVTRRQVLLGAAIGAAAVATVLWRLPFNGVHFRRLAVLPFANGSNDENTEVLADGITEVLIRQLSHVPNLAVIARSTVFHLKGTHDAREVGRRLAVDGVLTGSVLIRGERARVDVALVDAKTGARIWGDVLDRPGSDVLAIQNVIAAMIITRGLGIEASDAMLRELNGGLASDREAYRLFLLAVHHFRRDTEADYLTARRLLEDAVMRDRSFALAHLTLASTYSVMAIDGFELPLTAWPQSSVHVDRALEQDPDLPDAHAERATMAFFFGWDWRKAQDEWDIALQSRRANELQGELLTSYVLQQWALGRDEQALALARAARVIDPLSPMLAVREADVLAAMGKLSDAEER
jgi:eukaryotic-like serine/threonine-protein kinase